MPASQEQKVDFLLKKIGYSASKTGIAEDSSLTGSTKKAPFAEAIPSPLVIPRSSVWSDSGFIPTAPPTSNTTYVGIYTAANAYRMTFDNTVGAARRSFIARSTYGNQTASIDGNTVTDRRILSQPASLNREASTGRLFGHRLYFAYRFDQSSKPSLPPRGKRSSNNAN